MTGAGSAPPPGVNGNSRFLLMSSGLQARVAPAFNRLTANRLVGENANIGELREIMGAGYSRAFGMAGLHPLFHTSRDSAEMTSAALLEPVVQDFVQALRAVAEGQ
jgi:hypothetical protein